MSAVLTPDFLEAVFGMLSKERKLWFCTDARYMGLLIGKHTVPLASKDL